MNRRACPCCSYRTLESQGEYEICGVCFWEDDGTPEGAMSGANHMTLAQARHSFARIGAVSIDMVHYTRPPPGDGAHPLGGRDAAPYGNFRSGSVPGRIGVEYGWIGVGPSGLPPWDGFLRTAAGRVAGFRMESTERRTSRSWRGKSFAEEYVEVRRSDSLGVGRVDQFDVLVPSGGAAPSDIQVQKAIDVMAVALLRSTEPPALELTFRDNQSEGTL